MTTDTTAANTTAGKKQRPWMLYILGVSILLHVVGWFVLQPFGETVMAFDRAEEVERTEEVRKRELERAKRERERRQELPLTKEQSEQLKREAERRKRREITDYLRDLHEVREELEELRQRKLEEIHQRRLEDIAKLAIADIEREMAKLEERVENVTDTEETEAGENERLQEQFEHLAQQLQEMADNPAEAVAKANDLAQASREMKRSLDQARHSDEGEVGNRRVAATSRARRQADEVISAAQDLANMDAQRMNDTSMAKGSPPPPRPSAEQMAQMPMQELYNDAVAAEQQIHRANDDVRAAEMAMTHNSSFSQAQNMLHSQPPSRPQLGEQLAGQPSTVGELSQMREAMEQAAGQTQEMALSSQSMLAQAQGLGPQSGGMNRYAQQALLNQAMGRTGNGVINLTGLMGGSDGDSHGMSGDRTGEGQGMVQGREQESIHLDRDEILAKAMPGRMFTENSDRTGWLYIDTWYVIGPWENNSDIDFTNTHPPESQIDFDAEYHNGKYAGRDGHPYQTLRWEFVQSDHVRIEPPEVYPASTYYGYTEVFFSESRDMLIAVASDDAAKMWVNGTAVWSDFGQSAWKLDEGFRRVRFHKGFNKILVRIENGPVNCIWSVLLCPPEAVN